MISLPGDSVKIQLQNGVLPDTEFHTFFEFNSASTTAIDPGFFLEAQLTLPLSHYILVFPFFVSGNLFLLELVKTDKFGELNNFRKRCYTSE